MNIILTNDESASASLPALLRNKCIPSQRTLKRIVLFLAGISIGTWLRSIAYLKQLHQLSGVGGDYYGSGGSSNNHFHNEIKTSKRKFNGGQNNIAKITKEEKHFLTNIFRFFFHMIVGCLFLLGFSFILLAVIGLIKYIW